MSQTIERTDTLGLFLAHAKSRRKMTKAQLLADAEECDSAYLDMAMEKDMAEAYYLDLETHLWSHGCTREHISASYDPVVALVPDGMKEPQ